MINHRPQLAQDFFTLHRITRIHPWDPPVAWGTSMDVTLARCIKAAVDCPGHPLVKVAGAYAGGRSNGRGRGWHRKSWKWWENGRGIFECNSILEDVSGILWWKWWQNHDCLAISGMIWWCRSWWSWNLGCLEFSFGKRLVKLAFDCGEKMGI